MKLTTLGLCLVPGVALALDLLPGHIDASNGLKTNLNTFGEQALGYHAIDFNIFSGSHDNLVKRSMYKRNNIVLLDAGNFGNFYLVSLYAGADKQLINVQLDTGSSDLWFPSSNVFCDIGTGRMKRNFVDNEWGFDSEPTTSINDAFTTEPIDPVSKNPRGIVDAAASAEDNICTSYGSFNTGTSSSFKANATVPPFIIAYADNSSAKGVWGTDSLTLGGVSIPGFSFGVVTEVSRSIGILGIGLLADESTYILSGHYTYANFPLILKSTGYIKKMLYSIYLGNPYANTGQVLFGAVDHAKYFGSLVSLPILNSNNSEVLPYQLAIELDSIKIALANTYWSVGEGPYTCLLDTGATVCQFPADLLATFAKLVGATYSQKDRLYYMDCIADLDYHATFSFGGQDINVPLVNMQLAIDGSDTRCALGIMEQQGSQISLGDNFLQYAYVVYDLEDLIIAIAPASYGNDSQIEVVFSSIPSAVNSVKTSYTLPLATAAGIYLKTSLQSPVGGGVNSISFDTTGLYGVPTLILGTPSFITGDIDSATATNSDGSFSGISQELVTTTNDPQASSAVSASSADAGNPHKPSSLLASTGTLHSTSATNSPKHNTAANLSVNMVFGIFGFILALA